METLDTPGEFSSSKSKKRKKLLSLTFFRFFAASLIVLHHLNFKFVLTHNWFPLDSAVSFFYILSGFILTYSYPKLPDKKSIVGFYKARFARIWPVYIASTVILLILSRGSYLIGTDKKTYLFYLTMTQAWIPSTKFYFALIPASWSISDEVFFYLLFPLLIRNFANNWHIKLVLIVIISGGVVGLSNYFGLPGYLPGHDGITAHGLVYINPVVRIMEFVWGMCCALIFQHLTNSSKPQFTTRKSRLIGTFIEITIIVLIIVVAKESSQILSAINSYYPLGIAGGEWFGHGKLLMIPYGLLILVFALDLGWLSRIISAPKYIYFGEISFSMYLLHQPCLIILEYLKRKLVFMPGWIPVFVYLLIVLFLSHLMFKFVENPCRKLILKFGVR